MTTYNIEGGLEAPPAESPGRDFSGVNVSDPEVWAEADEDIDWLVEGVFAADQPTIIGARKKSLKTTLIVDLAISQVTCRPWLEQFTVPRKRKTLVIVGESSQRALIRRIKKACKLRGVPRDELNGMLNVNAATFPNLPDEADCISVQHSIEKHGFEMVVLDPLYMGLSGVNTSNLNEVGPALRRFKEACGDASVVICHHVKKSAPTEGAPDLDDLSQAGISEFAGNYWLMQRIGKYTGDGLHELAVAYGGRDEQFGMNKLAFDENNWSSEFTSMSEHQEEQQREAEQRARDDHDRVLNNARAAISKALRNEDEFRPKNWIESRCGSTKQKAFRIAFGDMLRDGTITEGKYEAPHGNGSRSLNGYALAQK
ncbi:MAG: AAA family ATPase [Planctomycetaceae bacterium]|nr:AAA family ATPase [Planctomycetaceae bacterium]